MNPRLSILILLAFIPLLRAESKIDFNRDVRPILADNCFACHGPDDKARKADLKLDTREGASSRFVDAEEAGRERADPAHHDDGQSETTCRRRRPARC